MALSIAEADAVSTRYFDKTLTSQVYEKSPFWTKLKQIGNISTDGGTKLQWPIRYKKSDQTGFVGPREQIVYSEIDTRTSAELDWRYLVGQAMISWDERVKNSGKEQIVNLLSDKTTEMGEDMLDHFNTALYAAAPGANDMESLHRIIDTGTTYAGIAVADAAEWAAAAEDASTTELKLYGSGSLSYMINQATFGTNKPNLHITTRDLWSKFESLIEPQKRYYGKETGLAKAGFTTLYFHDAEIVADYACTAAAWFGIDTDKFEIRYHKDWNMKKDPWKELGQAGYPNAMYKVCSWVGNIMCRMRKTSFKFTALDYTI